MFSKIVIFITAAFAVSTVALPGIRNSCNSGPIQCCDNFYAPNSAAAIKAIEILNVVVPKITGDIGTQCSPFSVIGVSKGASFFRFAFRLKYDLCNSFNDATPVCCEKNYSNMSDSPVLNYIP